MALLGPNGNEWLLVAIMMSLYVVPAGFYAWMISSTMKLVSESNRKLAPWEPYMLLVPLVNLGYMFKVVLGFAESMKKELGHQPVGSGNIDLVKTIGILMCVGVLGSIVPILGFLLTIGGMVCWVWHCVLVYRFQKILKKEIDSDVLDAEVM